MLVGEENETPFIRVCENISLADRFKALRGSPKRTISASNGLRSLHTVYYIRSYLKSYLIIFYFQIFSQPVFPMVEKWATRKYPNNMFVTKQLSMKLPMLPRFQVHVFRVCFRTAYVLSTTCCAVLFPYFNQVLGLIGAFNFWPIAIYFPVEMFLKQRKIRAWTPTWIVFRVLSFLCLLVSVFGFLGSLERICNAKFS